MDGNIVMNVEFVWDNVHGNPTEVQVVPCNIAWEDLELMLKVYADQSCLTVKYLDEDNDEILIQSQAEMLEPFGPKPEAKPLFYIKHEASGKVLDVEGHNAQPGARIILWKKKLPGRGVNVRNQLWFEDAESQTIRSAVNNLCITVKPNDIARMEKLQGDNVHQTWKFEKNRLQNARRSDWVSVASENNRLVLGSEENGPQKCTWIQEPAEKAAQDSPNQSGNYGRLLEEIRKATENGLNASEASEEANEMHFIFKETFEKFKSDLAEEISRKTAQKTVDGVLQGLESAVITSVSSGNTPQPQHAGKIPKNVSKPATYCHFGVICDICENTIIGPRYKCGNCADFDLCEECERHAELHHNPSHVFLKIRRPVALAGHEGQQKAPLLPFNVFDGSLPSPPQSSDAPMVDNWSQVDGRLQKLSNREMMKMVKLEERRLRCEAKMKRKEEKMRREKSKEQSREVPKTEITRHSHKDSISSEDGTTQTELSVKETEVQTGSNLLSANELLSFEMLNNENPPTIVPSNTPVVMSPPKSPIPDEMVDVGSLLSESTSSVELLEDKYDDTDEEHRSYADERLSSIELKPNAVTVEEVGSDLESDFIVVPIPDCFNPDLPPSASASTSIIIKKAEEREVSVDEMLTVSRSIESPLLEPEPVAGEGDVVDDETVVDEEPVACVPEHDDSQDEVEEEEEEDKEEEEDDEEEEEEDEEEEEGEEEEEKEVVVDKTVPEESASTVAAQEAKETAAGAEGEVTIVKVNELSTLTDDGEPEVEIHVENIPRNSSSSSVVSSAVRFAHTAATQAYSTAKDVFNTLQAHSQYVPPQQNWQPPPEQDDWTPVNTEDSFMQTLFEMGFGNREKNRKLLEKYNFDLDRVIQDLIQENENEWNQTRH
ncbi:hypothetical protein CAPTEDRAFT_224314 [Capitella teleta]|uniref:ZZ-type domain-containing protein n=1 Tax=Capitella teleta TaxID=283909 RepID=R7U5M1_CAPTE|nr:hypothetical protein CAPTEDRAFT_224314 [Capitella teleta]|eukprot:ELU01274.1 hypothetical protein CAPTEDRAFT_224314 [Capitella teleta]